MPNFHGVAGQRIVCGDNVGISPPGLTVPADSLLLGFSGCIGGRGDRKKVVALIGLPTSSYSYPWLRC